MSKIISSIVALMLCAALIPAFAAQGDKGFYYGAKNPEHLAQLIDAALVKNKQGTTRLDAAKCDKDGSCATPLDYFEAINEAFKKAGLKKRLKDVSEVPAYMRTLKVVHRPYGRYEVSCLRPLGNDKFKLIMNCIHEREFEPDEDAWIDSTTEDGVKIDLTMITSKCANVVYRKVVLKITIVGHKCENGYELTANAWLRSQFPTELGQQVDALIATANARESRDATDLNAYQTDAISRTLGKRLREEVKVRAPITTDIQIRYTVVDSEGKVVVDSQTKRPTVYHVGILHMVNGVGTFKFPDNPRGHIVGTVWPEMFISPAISGGERRLRIFPKEWGDACAVHMHGIVP